MMNTLLPTLSPLPRDQRKIDAEHLNLPASFHFVGVGLAGVERELSQLAAGVRVGGGWNHFTRPGLAGVLRIGDNPRSGQSLNG